MATNNINNKIYIGQTCVDLESRKLHHKCNSKRNNYLFANAIQKYGFDNFTWSVIFLAKDRKELNEKEIFFIKHFDSMNKEKGYNMTLGGIAPILSGELNGMWGKTHTDEVKKSLSLKMSMPLEERLGKEKSDNMKLKISILHTGRKNTPETILKMKESSYWKGKGHLMTGENSPAFGTKRTEEQKQKMSREGNGMWGKGYLVAKEKNGMWGKTHSPELVEEMKIKMKGSGNNNYREIPQETIDKMIVLYNSGFSVADVAKLVNENVPKVTRELKFNGVKLRSMKEQINLRNIIRSTPHF